MSAWLAIPLSISGVGDLSEFNSKIAARRQAEKSRKSNDAFSIEKQAAKEVILSYGVASAELTK